MQRGFDVNIARRSGAGPTSTVLLWLALGAPCAATAVACSSGAAQQLLAGSGGGPLGGGASADDATSPIPAPAEAGGSTAPPEAGEVDGSASDAADASEAAPVDSGDPRNTFTLLDTSITNVQTGSPVPGYDPILENAVIDLTKVGTQLSIRANTTLPTVGSVQFALDTTYMHAENATPYTLCSDNGAGVVTNCNLTIGKHVLVVTPYTLANLGGTASSTTTLYFEIVQSDAGANDAGGGG